MPCNSLLRPNAAVIWNGSSICFTLTSKVFGIFFTLGGTITKGIERCCHKHSNSLTAELNGVPLYGLVWVACKPPAVALHEDASLSGIHVWTGDNCRLCCQEKGWLGVTVFSVCPFFYLLLKTTKMENNRRVIPASLCDLDKERSSGSQTSKAVFRS